jgi:hypothetical protein
MGLLFIFQMIYEHGATVSLRKTQSADYAIGRRKHSPTLSSNVKYWLVGELIS